MDLKSLSLAKLYIKDGTPGCASLGEFLCFAIKYHSFTKRNLYTAGIMGADKLYLATNVGELGQVFGLWTAPGPRDRLKLTDAGQFILSKFEARIVTEPIFDKKAWDEEQARLKDLAEKEAGRRPTIGEMIYLRKGTEISDYYTIKVGSTKIPVALKAGWRSKTLVERKPYAVVNLHEELDPRYYYRKEDNSKITFVMIMVKGQLVAVHPDQVLKLRPAGQGLNKRKKRKPANNAVPPAANKKEST